MSVSKHQILTLLEALEACQPLYAGAMPLADDVVRDTFAAALAGVTRSPDYALADQHCRELSLMASLTHALIEVTYLREQLQSQLQSAAAETARLCARIAAR